MLFLEELKTIYKTARTFPQACGSLAKSTCIRHLFDTRPPHLKNSVAVSYHLQASMQFKIQSSGYFPENWVQACKNVSFFFHCGSEKQIGSNTILCVAKINIFNCETGVQIKISI